MGTKSTIYRIPFVQPLGDKHCILYGLANVLGSDEIINTRNLDIYKKAFEGDFGYTSVTELVWMFTDGAINMPLVACLPPTKETAMTIQQVRSKLYRAAIGSVTKDQGYRCFMILTAKKDTDFSAPISLHSLFIIACESMAVILNPAHEYIQHAPSGDGTVDTTVLLSQLCTTFDIFAMYEVCTKDPKIAYIIGPEYFNEVLETIINYTDIQDDDKSPF